MRIVTMTMVMMTICFMKFLRATRMWELKHRITKVHQAVIMAMMLKCSREVGGRLVGVWDVDVWMDQLR